MTSMALTWIGSSKYILFVIAMLDVNLCDSPVAEDRGGIEEDFDNYVNLLARLRRRLNSSGREYGLTLTLVSTSVPAYGWRS